MELVKKDREQKVVFIMLCNFHSWFIEQIKSVHLFDVNHQYHMLQLL